MTTPAKPKRRSSRTQLFTGVYMKLEAEGRERLKALMHGHDVTHRQLAQIAGWSTHSYLGKLLRGDANTLAPEPATKIAEHFGLDVNDLFVARLSTNTGHSAQSRRSA